MTSSLFLSLRTLGIPLERHFVKGKAELLPGSSYHRTKSESLEKMLRKQRNFRKSYLKTRNIDTVVHILIPNKCLAAVQKSMCIKKNLSLFFLNNQMNASVFYTWLSYCTLRSWNCYFVSRVFIDFYLQLWNCGVWCFHSYSGFSFARFQPLSVLYRSHSHIPHLYD